MYSYVLGFHTTYDGGCRRTDNFRTYLWINFTTSLCSIPHPLWAWYLCGLLVIEPPDAQLLQSYADYELWRHDDNCPITVQQLGECVVIGSSIDGDFLAVHPQVEGLLWLPRHSEVITKKPLDVQVPFTDTLEHILQDEFGRIEPFPVISNLSVWIEQQHFYYLIHPRRRKLAVQPIRTIKPCK